MSFFQFTDLYVSGGDEPFNSAFKQDLAVGGTDRAAADKRDGAVDVSSSLVSGKAKNLRTANTLSGSNTHSGVFFVFPITEVDIARSAVGSHLSRRRVKLACKRQGEKSSHSEYPIG